MTSVEKAGTSRTRRYPLDALRAIAALGVLGFHAYQNNKFAGTDTYAWNGLVHELLLSTDALVALFFVISGFVLWLPVARAAVEGREQRPARVLLVRRAARLVPLYLVVVLVVWAFNNPGLPAQWQDLLLHLSFTQVYSDQYIFWTVGPAWSLAVEFHFYVLIALSIPLLSRWTRGSTSRRRRLAGLFALPALMITAGVGWLVWAIHLSPQPGDAWAVWFNPLAKAPIFALGILLAVLVAAGHRLAHRVSRVLLGTVAAAIFVGGTLVRASMPGQTAQWLGPAFGLAAAAFVSVIVMNEGSPMRWLTWRPLVSIGILSYSIYLLHEPVMRLVRGSGLMPEQGSAAGIAATFAAVVVITIALAKVTYATIERYGMKLADVIGANGRLRDNYAHDISDPLAGNVGQDREFGTDRADLPTPVDPESAELADREREPLGAMAGASSR